MLNNILTSSCSAVASNEMAWKHTAGDHGLRMDPPPDDVMHWATASTADATSWAHLDTAGLATVVTVACGEKYWVVFNRRRNLPDAKSLGDMASIRGLPDNHRPWSAILSAFEHEGVWLKPGSVL